MVSPSSLLRRMGLAFGLSLLLGSAAVLVLTRAGEEAPTLAAEGGGHGTTWAPAPLLALLLVAGMSGLVLLVSLQPRRG